MKGAPVHLLILVWVNELDSVFALRYLPTLKDMSD